MGGNQFHPISFYQIKMRIALMQAGFCQACSFLSREFCDKTLRAVVSIKSSITDSIHDIKFDNYAIQ